VIGLPGYLGVTHSPISQMTLLKKRGPLSRIYEGFNTQSEVCLGAQWARDGPKFGIETRVIYKLLRQDPK
jgi:hypothetical protein